MKDRADTQCDKILQYMKQYGSITPADALNNFGCFRLAARIADLRRQGVGIRSEMETATSKDGTRVKFARYSLAE